MYNNSSYCYTVTQSKLADKKLPAGSRIISAVNEGEEYQLTDLDPALVSCFNIFIFEPSVEEWLVWASKNKLQKALLQIKICSSS